MRQSRNFFATFAGRVLIAALVAVVVPVMLGACGPAFRFRPAGLLAAGDVEIGGGLAAGARLDGDGGFGGAEGQAFVRWTPEKAPRLELAHRFFTHSFITMGWSPEFRIQPVKGPFDLTIDFGGVFGLCWTLCGQDIDQHPIGAAIGFDVGLSVGKRFGGDKAAAVYFSPHYQMAWTVVDATWPGRMLLHFPIGMDIPLGNKHVSLRPEFVFTLQLRGEGYGPLKRMGGGIALAVNGPSPKKARKLRKERKAAEAAAAEEAAAAAEAPAEAPAEEKAPE